MSKLTMLVRSRVTERNNSTRGRIGAEDEHGETGRVRKL